MRFLHTIPWCLLANFGHCGLFRALNTWRRGRRQRKRFRSAVQHESKIPFHQASGSTHIHLRGCRWDWWPKNAPQLQTGFEVHPNKTWFYLQISKNSAWEDLAGTKTVWTSMCMPSPSPACKVQTCLICVATWNSCNPETLQVVVLVHFGTPVLRSISSFWSILISFMASSQQVHQLFVSWEVIVSILNHCIAKISNWTVRQLTQPGCWSSCECSIGLGRSHKRNLRIEMHGENRLCECPLLGNEHTALRWSSHLESGRKSTINGAIRPKYAVYLIMVERCIHFPARMITQATYIFKQRKVFWEGQVATENRSSAAASEHLKDQIPGETWMTWGDSNKLGLRCLLTLRLILQW